jgi:hypothetical protein
MAAISTCGSEPRKRAWQKGGVHVCRYLVHENIGENARHTGNLLNIKPVLLDAKAAFVRVLMSHLATKSA